MTWNMTYLKKKTGWMETLRSLDTKKKKKEKKWLDWKAPLAGHIKKKTTGTNNFRGTGRVDIKFGDFSYVYLGKFLRMHRLF